MSNPDPQDEMWASENMEEGVSVNNARRAQPMQTDSFFQRVDGENRRGDLAKEDSILQLWKIFHRYSGKKQLCDPHLCLSPFSVIISSSKFSPGNSPLSGFLQSFMGLSFFFNCFYYFSLFIVFIVLVLF